MMLLLTTAILTVTILKFYGEIKNEKTAKMVRSQYLVT